MIPVKAGQIYTIVDSVKAPDRQAEPVNQLSPIEVANRNDGIVAPAADHATQLD
jgi:hypothetical protein